MHQQTVIGSNTTQTQHDNIQTPMNLECEEAASSALNLKKNKLENDQNTRSVGSLRGDTTME
jgi:hypothetical protein